MIKKNINVVLWCSSYSHFEKKYRTKETKLIKIRDNFYIYSIKSLAYLKNVSVKRYLNNLSFERNVKNFFETIEKPNLILLSVPPVDSAFAFIRFAKKNNIKLISDFRDMWPDIIDIYLTGILNLLFKPFYFWMNYKIIKIRNNSNFIISVSKGMLKWILNKGKNYKRSKFIYISHTIKKLPYSKTTKINLVYSGVLGAANKMVKFLEMFIDLNPE